jgi:hypothetical protein
VVRRKPLCLNYRILRYCKNAKPHPLQATSNCYGLSYCDVLPKKPANQRFIARQQFRKYAIVDKAVFSPCRAEDNRPEPKLADPSRGEPSRERIAIRVASPHLVLLGNSYKHLDDAEIRKGHVTTLATTQQLKAFSRMSDPRVYRSPQ